MFDMLRNSVGDDAFFKGLKNYFSDNLCKIASPESLYACFMKFGTDLEGFFGSFTEGKILI